jgi:Holliday junction resolvasome RuvABC endonuclease subunit
MTLILSLDISIKNTGLCISEDGVEEYHSVSTSKLKVNPFVKLKYILDEILEILNGRKIDILLFEEFVTASFKKTCFLIGRVHGILIPSLINGNTELYGINPMRLKKACGYGKANKAYMMEYCYTQYDLEFVNDDQADAFLILKTFQNQPSLFNDYTLKRD